MELATYTESQFVAQVRHEAAEARKPYAFMLPNSLGSGWFLESRYATQAELDDAVRVFVEESRDDFDGYAPVNGKDFLAVMVQNY